MKVLGLDVSTRTGLSVIEVEGGHYGVAEAAVLQSKPSKDRMGRWHGYAELLLGYYERHKPKLVVVEGYGYANKHTLATLVEIGGILRYTLYRAGATWIEVSPNSLKRFATGNGAARKSMVLQQLYKAFNLETDDEDVADATVAALFGAQLLGAGIVKDKKRLEAVEKWEKAGIWHGNKP